jgi:two-component system OmpR family sensor kinase
MRRSFRFRMAARFTAAMFTGLLALSIFTYVVIRETLDRQINASLLNVASIQAASVTDSPDGEMRFHEWELTPEEAAQVRDLNRFAQIWNEDGESLLRTRYITTDLPVDRASLAEAAAGSIVWEEASFDGIPIRALYYPLGRLGVLHHQHVLQVAAPLETRNRLVRRTFWFLAGVVVLISAGAFGGSWWLAGRLVRPVHEITGQAEEIGAETLGRRISAYADSIEYQRLVHVLNTMLARLDDAFDAQRRFTADASHELRSPLTALRGELELARRRERSTDEYRRVLDSALEEVDRLARITDDLLTLARSDAGVLEPRLRTTDLAERAAAVIDRLDAEAGRRGLILRLEARGQALACVDPDLADRAIWNLVANAVKFTPEGGHVEVRVQEHDGGVRVEVADTGPGIPDGAADRLFDRFVQLDDARSAGTDHGAGLGLAIVKAIADAHGGRTDGGNRPGGGAVFGIWFPAGAT